MSAGFDEVKKASTEVRDLIKSAHERGQFNPSYFEPEFEKWYAEKVEAIRDDERNKTLRECTKAVRIAFRLDE